MFNQAKKSKSVSNHQSHIELALLDSLVIDEVAYPWNPADPESETYFQAIEQDLSLEELTDEALATSVPTWVAQLEQVWSEVDSEDHPARGAIEQLKEVISGKFADLVPIAWLEAIAHQASKVQTGGQELKPISLTEQLVQCVQTVLPDWSKEDLQVLARPYGFAMRGNPQESTLAVAENRQWTELSDIERVRVSLAIARYALVELKKIED